jgi:hypothetical protein
MNFYRPISSLPLWFIEDLPLPEIDYDSLNWENIRDESSLLHSEIYLKRDKAPSAKNEDHPSIVEIRNTIHQMFDEMENSCDCNSILRWLWPINTWKRDENFHFDIKKDSAGFEMYKHLDNRNIKWALILNLEDNTCSTEFHINDQPSFSGPTKRGSGVFYFNHHEMLHSISVDSTRYIVFYMNVIG